MMYTASLAALLVGVAMGAPTSTPEIAAACAAAPSGGCCHFCGYEAVKAGEDTLCMPTGSPTEFPFLMDADDKAEYCELVSTNHGCNDVCGYKWHAGAGECRKIAVSHTVADAPLGAAPIIGGSGKWRYQYMPEKLQMPGASLVNCHGLVTDKDNNIYLTYQNDGKDKNCLIKWKPDGTGGEFPAGQSDELCSGTPHGLKIKTEGGVEVLYHANNNQKLSKTDMTGKIIWQDTVNPGKPTDPYRPTWFATPPDSDFEYMCDGYGSNHVYLFNSKGEFQNKTWGGRSPKAGVDAPHGTFSTNHGCTYDPRNTTAPNTIIVSDRANHRFEFFHYDPATGQKFDYYKTVDFAAALGSPGTLPCNLRMYPDQDGRAIVPDLAGPVAVMNNAHEVISVVNVSVLLAAQQHKHPHDAILLANGDMVVATWAPGRISYWKLLPVEEDEHSEQ